MTTCEEVNATSSDRLGLRNPGEWQPGAVEFTNWRRVPWTDKLAIGVHGEVAVVSSDGALGFEMRGGDHANWIALVKGPSGVVHAVPGCKIATITYDVHVACCDYVAVP